MMLPLAEFRSTEQMGEEGKLGSHTRGNWGVTHEEGVLFMPVTSGLTSAFTAEFLAAVFCKCL